MLQLGFIELNYTKLSILSPFPFFYFLKLLQLFGKECLNFLKIISYVHIIFTKFYL